jgi:tRNA nucleotidyltransferase (CCA-adding enzyme)
MVRNGLMAKPGRTPEELEAALRATLPQIAELRAAAQGSPLFLVGGAVRDLLLGRARGDVDVVIEGDAAIVAARLGGEVVEHERFATARADVGGLEVDLASARTETYTHPGALPEVRPATLAEDLARRDFTINAMALPLQGRIELIDPRGGAADLDAGLLRVLHSGSFRDDPTRALRAARYAARFGFALEEETEALLGEADLSTVSRDRIQAELRKIAAEAAAARASELIRAWGLLELREDAPELIAKLDLLLQRPPWSEVVSREAGVLAALAPPGAERELAEARPGRPSEAVELARGRPPAELALARAMGAEWLDPYVQEWRSVVLEIDGRDLIAAGVAEGPAVGRGLATALRRKLDGEIDGREQELAAALAAAHATDG